MAKKKNIKNSLITVNPSPSSHLLHPFSLIPLHSFHFSSKKNPRTQNHHLCASPNPSLFFLFLLIFFAFFGIFQIGFTPISHPLMPCSSIPSWEFHSISFPPFLSAYSPLRFSSLSTVVSEDDDKPRLSRSAMVPLPAHGVTGNLTEEERDFWQQPDGDGYKPCLEFNIEYRRASAKISKEKRRFLVVVVSGGINQQRNQIVDAVVIARILEAALVVPILKVNLIWEDESEFSDIFDVEHFKKTLQADVRILSSLPSTHLIPRKPTEKIPLNVSPLWIRSKFSKELEKEGVLVLKGLDSKLSKNLPSNLQKLRCKVAFHALRFAAPIRELGNRLARRMWIEGPYIAVHLRLEKDVWVRTGCLTGLGSEYDNIISREQKYRPEYLTGRLNMGYERRKLAGLCPLTGLEIARLLKALGAPGSARVYIAGGEPFGSSRALQPLQREFSNLVTKEMLAHDGELAPFINRSSAMAAIDYIVSLNSEVFMPSHGGNMGRAMQGYRAYVGHRKYIKPNKRAMFRFFEDPTISDVEFGRITRQLHRKLVGQPEPRTKKIDRDVLAYPVPECMCKHRSRIFLPA